jgi:ketosteroid isomerase-like protein
MSQENVEIVRRLTDAFNRGDRDAALVGYAPEVEWHTTGRFVDEGVYRGLADIEQLLGELERDMNELRLRISEIRAAGEDKVFVATTFAGRGKRSKARVEQQLWFVNPFSAGLIVRVDNYPDRARALEAAGLTE